MKKLISITLCLVMVLALASTAFATLKPVTPGFTLPSGGGGKLPIGGGGGDLPGLETSEKKAPAKVQAFVDAVDAIGTVTAESGPMIEAAEAAYTAMTTANMWTLYQLEYPDFWQPALETLNAAKRAYAALTATQAPTEAPTQAPTEAPTQAPTQAPTTPSEPVDPAGDNTFMVIAMVVLSMTALVVLVSKKRAI